MMTVEHPNRLQRMAVPRVRWDGALLPRNPRYASTVVKGRGSVGSPEFLPCQGILAYFCNEVVPEVRDRGLCSLVDVVVLF